MNELTNTGHGPDRPAGPDLPDRQGLSQGGWLLDLADRTRDEAEPGWLPDLAEIVRGGRRRRRLRAATVGSGALGVLAVTLAVVLGLGGAPGSTAWRSEPAAPTAPTDIFRYYQYGVSEQVAGGPSQTGFPRTPAAELAALADGLDPHHVHLLNGTSPPPGRGADVTFVSDDDPSASGITTLTVDAIYRPDGKAAPVTARSRVGHLKVTVTGKNAALRRDPLARPDPHAPCGFSMQIEPWTVELEQLPDVTWTPCSKTDLPDHSTISITSTPIGPGTAIVAVRKHPDGTGIAVVWTDFADMFSNPAPPDPSRVLSPNPYSEQTLTKVLSAPALGADPGAGLSATPPPAQFLTAADFGTGGVYDVKSTGGYTSSLPINSGCVYGEDPTAKHGRSAMYTATSPSGEKLAVTEAEYPRAAGTGAVDMAAARSRVWGDCKEDPKDTTTDLPAGIGDGAFVKTSVEHGYLAIWIRFGDTIVQVQMESAARDSTGGSEVPDLSSAADQQWLVGIARQAAERWTAE